MERRSELSLLDAAAELSAYDEYPVLLAEIDPQLHLSRNDRDQPFFLICDHDTVLIQMAGTSRVRMMSSPVLWEVLELGDFLYVPARTPHRIEILEPSVHVRFKAAKPAVEGVAWFCDNCASEVHRIEFDVTEEQLVQDGYVAACAVFNSDATLRTCDNCETVHEPVDLTGIRWQETAELIRTAAGAAEQRPHATGTVAARSSSGAGAWAQSS
ncbi:hypothetical protein OQ968_02075 [Mycobacterium sp. 663a-19]|uniref:JmjC domain-containing protein n=1 Tax=Mycobacterium sp. 663a-19 TaxID=2986148 RepID=UPI002D1E6524|nr:cupin domain-containing protein [Mycobacterium sp. 663a-19]MEB3980048.1 hypothetical protein [Mycobacterium sp. 663a-19]